MASPRLTVKDTGFLITDVITAYSYWNMAWGKVIRTPISGGAYPQNTTSATLRFSATLWFGKDHPTAPLDNYFTLFELEREDATQRYRFRDLEGWVRDCQIVKVQGWDEQSAIVDLRNEQIMVKDYIEVPTEFVVPGYLPAELGP